MRQLNVQSGLLALVCAWVCALGAAAQDTPPTGPAQIMNRANAGRARREVAQANAAGDQIAEEATAKAPSANAVPAATPAAPHPPGGMDPHVAAAGAAQPTADLAADLPAGTLQVDVIGVDGKPYAGGQVILGIMKSMGGRDELPAKTDANGRHTFTALPVGSAQAYRVNVSSGGAKFSTNPFRLPDHAGFRARVPLRETTRNDQLVIGLLGQTVVELRDDRLHMTQQARVTNAGERVFVLPREGLLVPLPAGFTAFQWQDVMTDQKATEVLGKGFRIKGSLPPGTFNLAWTYDVQRDGAGARIPVSVPFRTYAYRVIVEAPDGLSLRVSDFPEAEKVKDEGRNLLFTQLRRAPPDAPIGAFSLRIDGIPGPGPGRWVATVLFALTVAFGLWLGVRRPDDAETVAERRRLFGDRKAALLEAVGQLDTELATGAVGPEFHESRLTEIETELAMVLRDEASLPATVGP